MKNFAIVLTLLCTWAAAQDKPAVKAPQSSAEKAAAMQAPKPPPEMAKLLKVLAGTWTTSEKFEPSEWMPKGGTGSGKARMWAGPGGLSVLQDYRSDSQSALPGFVGHGVVWWDPQAQGYRSVWCDSMTPGGCEFANGLGKWVGDEVVFTWESEQGGRKTAMKEVYTDLQPDSFTMTMDIGVPGGELKRTMTIQHKRLKGAVAAPKPRMQ